ncbi:hypothetical protein CCP3SC15_1480004 [Gammaproteobacteria bacterium]
MNTDTVCIDSPKTPPLSHRKQLVTVLASIGVSIMCLWMAKIMMDMSYHMGKMTAYVGSMSNNVDHMSKDIFVMQDQFLKMTIYVNGMEFTLKELNSHMIDMESTVSDVDKHMIQMQGNLKEIQASMAKDMGAMRTNVGDLESYVKFMAANVTGMNVKMNRMVYDINRGASSFSSPFNYMQNMMSPQ